MPLTREQKAALWAPEPDCTPVTSLTVVSARPGTGKTTTVTEYCIDVVEGWRHTYRPWQGMAVLSYTNVARQELVEKIRKRGTATSLLNAPHFVGTIDAFVNQHVFLPFGAAQMGFGGGRPKLVGEPYGLWRPPSEIEAAWPTNLKRKPLLFDCYTLDVDDFPLVTDRVPRTFKLKVPIAAKEPSTANAKDVQLMKRHVWTHGLATQSDANYLAYKTLAASPILTRSLVRRFPVLVIDEAQDMTAVQHALLSHLVSAGMRHVVLVGDEYQAIYEWNTAKPSLFTARKTENGWLPRPLSETFRCSPAICAALASMTPGEETVKVAAEGKNRDYSEPIHVRGYDKTNEGPAILAAFDEIAKMLTGLTPHDNADGLKTVAVIGRAGGDAPRLQTYFTGDTTRPAAAPEWQHRLTRDYLRVVHCLTAGQLYAAFAAYEGLLFSAGDYRTKGEMRRTLAEQWASGEADPLLYRRAIARDLRVIEAEVKLGADLSISGATGLCEVNLAAVPAPLLAKFRRDCAAFGSSAKRSQDRMLSTLFVAKDERTYFPHRDYPDARFVFSTIHGVKGETYDGVVFYTKAKSDTCSCPPGSKSPVWSKILTHNLGECEHKRLAYVALSRAAQVLFILAPDDSLPAWRALAGAG